MERWPAACSYTTTAACGRRFPVMRIQTILCPVDMSEISRRAFDYATTVAGRFGARLSVIEVIDWRLPPMASGVPALAEVPPDVQTSVLDALNALTAPARAIGVPTEISIESGDVVRR